MNYLFDFDGTLVDSMDVAIDALLGFLKERGVQYPDNIVSVMLPLGYKGIAKYFAQEFALQGALEEIYGELVARLIRAYAQKVEANVGAVPFLRRLKEEGHGIYLLTGSPKEFFVPCLQRLGVYDLFDGCWSVAEFGKTKSEPALYEEVAKKIAARPQECVVVDDSEEALRTAKSVGMKTVGVYDKYSAHRENAIKEFVDEYVYDFC